MNSFESAIILSSELEQWQSRFVFFCILLGQRGHAGLENSIRKLSPTSDEIFTTYKYF